MIDGKEFRPGNRLLCKRDGRIREEAYGETHAQMLATGKGADLFPVVLNEAVLRRCGFEENSTYALLPTAHEYLLELPVPAPAQVQVKAYIKSGGECLAFATVNGVAASAMMKSLHTLQNLYHALVGAEMETR